MSLSSRIIYFIFLKRSSSKKHSIIISSLKLWYLMLINKLCYFLIQCAVIVLKRFFADFLWQTQINLIYYQETTNLIDELRIVAFQLIIYKKKLEIIFANDLQKTFDIVVAIHLRSALIRFKIRTTRSTFIDQSDKNNFFFSKWVIDKSTLRLTIKIFLQVTVNYRNNFVKSRVTDLIEFEFSTFFCEQSSKSISSSHIIIRNNMTTESSAETENIENISRSQQTKKKRINVIVAKSLNAYFSIRQSSTQAATKFQNFNKSNDNDQRQSMNEKEWTCEKIEFFNSIVENTTVVVNVRKHVFYRDVYTFVDRLKNMIISRDSDKLRNIISQCFRSFVLIWHSTKLSDLKKDMLKKASLSMWYNVLIKRFKKRTFIALINIQFFRYIMKDARKHKNFRVFAQKLFRHAKTANMMSMHNQMFMIWNNLNWQFRRDISEFTKSISMRHFLNQLDSYFDIWFEMTNDIKKIKEYRKSFVAKSYQSWDRNDNSNRNTLFIFKNNAYQDRSQKNSSNRYDFRNDTSRKKRSTRMKVTTKVKSKSKEQNYNRASKNQNYNKFWDKRRYDKEKFDKDKAKVYTADEHIETNDSDEFENYHHSKDMIYFKSEKNDDTNSKNIFANIFVTLSVICRICKAFFVSNNALHKHFRNAHCNTHHKADFFNIDVNHVNVKKFVSKRQLDKSTIQIAKLAIVSFRIDFNKNIEIEYEFRDWQYVIAQLSLTENASDTSKCIDSRVEITFANTKFFKAQIKNFVSIQIMIIFITVRNLEANRHSSNKYVIVSMYSKAKTYTKTRCEQW